MRQLLLIGAVLAAGPGPLVAGDANQAAIQKSIDAYVAAFNRADAATLANLWSEPGELITATGEHWQGRRQIEQQFADYFAGTKNAKLELADTQIEMQSPGTAVETGLARVMTPNQEPSETLYRAIHVKTPDGWRIDSVRETEVPSSPSSPSSSAADNPLEPLAGMVGDWSSETEENTKVESSCHWSRNKHFLIQSFHVKAQGQDDFEGTQIIGWDPHAKTIRSWLFDSDGGFGSGRWTRSEDEWTVRTLQVLPDGRTGSATNIYQAIGKDQVRFRSIGRQVADELLPNIGPVTIVRKP